MKKYSAVIFLLFLLGAYTELYAVTFNDGLIHIINSGNSYPFEEIVVSDGPGSTTTTVIVETGGQASGIDASENSVITLDGGYLTAPFYVRDNVELSVIEGSVTQINALANSKVWVSGGTTSDLNCENCSYLNVSGGLFTWGLKIHNLDYGEVSGGSMATIDTWSSELHFFGGKVTDQLAVFGTSIINVFAGDFPNDFHINDNSKTNVYGGNFPYGIFTHYNGQLNIYGGFFDDTIKAFDTSEIIFSGYGFNYPDGDITAISGTLTGFLDDGTPINIEFGRATTATITLNSVPEPVTINIDIKPRARCPNRHNINKKKFLKVAILGTEDFDITAIDRASIRLEGISPIRSRIRDVNRPVGDPQDECDCTREGPDGIYDLRLKFYTQEIIDAIGDVSHREQVVLTLTGELTDGTTIEGKDCLIIIDRH